MSCTPEPELVKFFPTCLTGSHCILLQFQTLQVEGITVVSERHPRPLSQGMGAIAGVDPLVSHRLIWQIENTVKLTFYTDNKQNLLNVQHMHGLVICSITVRWVQTLTTNLTDSCFNLGITGSHSPLSSSGHVTTSSQLIGLPTFPV